MKTIQGAQGSIFMKTIQEAQDSIFADIPEENWSAAGDIQEKLRKAWSVDEDNFSEYIEQIRKDAIEKYKNVVYSHYKFPIENGHLFDGAFEIAIRNNVAKIVAHTITPAVKLLIEAHGGIGPTLEIVSEAEMKRKVKPIKWQEKEVEVERGG